MQYLMQYVSVSLPAIIMQLHDDETLSDVQPMETLYLTFY